MLRRLAMILEMIKFSHTLFALPFALLSAALASHREGGWRPLDLVGVLVCMVFARSAAMAFNRWADRLLDAQNPRTANRGLPKGDITPGQTLAFTLVCCVGFVSGTAIFWFSSGNLWPTLLSAPVLLFLLGYSYAKRFTSLAHVWLGVALALSPTAAWIAIRPVLEFPPLLLSLTVALWVTGFDILYACQDIDVDRKLGLHSIPAKLGVGGAFWVARIAHLLMVVALASFGYVTPELRLGFWIGYLIVLGLLAMEHWLVRNRDLQRINIAFFHVNAVISMGLLMVTLFDLYLPTS